MGNSRLGSLLVTEGLLSESDRRTVRQICGQGGAAFARGVLAMGLMDEIELAAFLAEKTRWRMAKKDLFKESSQEVWSIFDSALLEFLEAFPLKKDGQKIYVAMVDPLDLETINQLEFFSNLKVHPVIATQTQIRDCLKKMLQKYSPVRSTLENFISNHAPAASRRIAIKENITIPQIQVPPPSQEEEHTSPKHEESHRHPPPVSPQKASAVFQSSKPTSTPSPKVAEPPHESQEDELDDLDNLDELGELEEPQEVSAPREVLDDTELEAAEESITAGPSPQGKAIPQIDLSKIDESEELGDFDIDGDDPSLEDPSLEDPSLEDPSLEDPSLEDPSLEDPSLDAPIMNAADELSSEDPLDLGPSDDLGLPSEIDAEEKTDSVDDNFDETLPNLDASDDLEDITLSNEEASLITPADLQTEEIQESATIDSGEVAEDGLELEQDPISDIGINLQDVEPKVEDALIDIENSNTMAAETLAEDLEGINFSDNPDIQMNENLKEKSFDSLGSETPVDETPVDETPVDETPVDETLVDETLVDETQLEGLPAIDAPLDETLTFDKPLDEPILDDSVPIDLPLEVQAEDPLATSLDSSEVPRTESEPMIVEEVPPHDPVDEDPLLSLMVEDETPTSIPINSINEAALSLSMANNRTEGLEKLLPFFQEWGIRKGHFGILSQSNFKHIFSWHPEENSTLPAMSTVKASEEKELATIFKGAEPGLHPIESERFNAMGDGKVADTRVWLGRTALGNDKDLSLALWAPSATANLSASDEALLDLFTRLARLP